MRWSAPCNILLFNKEGKVRTTEGTIPVWLYGLHLIYTNYGDIGAWPMPNKKLKNQYMKEFSNPSAISVEHKEYLFRIWMQYLKSHSDEARRWIPFNPANDP
jgi:hypothetical protein